MLFTRKYKYDRSNLITDNVPISIRDEIKYLGVTVDKSCLFKAHLKNAAGKAERICAQLCRIMSNVGGPRESR